ncbi:unnamed protein product [Paramecium octaurelia]|uniref:Uncharacterized protein n=1 Tax=Paramecium octaurelia TaxID=43137 RepID=A0A8S1SZ28_PAROT|nr:unnamed protein product [Paramecium octaurelia]
MQNFETVEIVNPTVDYLIIKCGQNLYEHYLCEKEPGYNCEVIANWQCGVVQQEFLPFDHGESKYAILNKWIDEDEPHFKTIDNMTAKGVKIVKLQPPQTGQDTLDDARSQRSQSSSRFSRNSIAKFQNSVSKMKLINKLGGSSQQMTTLQSTIQEEYKPNLIKMPETKKPPTPDAIIERLREQREYQELDKQKENERMRKIKEEQIEQDEKKKEQLKQLKNKQYTYDYDGQVVFLTTKPIDLQINEILSPETKTNQPQKVMREVNSQPEIKPVKEAFAKGEDENRKLEKAAAVEYPKQPPLIEAMKSKQGTNIIFDNGYIKEGGEYKIPDRMSKRDYQTMVDGLQQKNKKQYDDAEDGVVEEMDTYEQKIYDAINREGDRNIKISNEQHFKWMMEDEDIKKSYRSSSAESANAKSIYESKKQSKKHTKEKEKTSPKKLKSQFDRINAYKNFDDVKKPQNLKASKLHKALNEFDSKLQSPKWGYTEDKEIPLPNSTIYKLKHKSESQPKLPLLKQKGRI